MISYSHHDQANMRHVLQPYEALSGTSKNIDKKTPKPFHRVGSPYAMHVSYDLYQNVSFIIHQNQLGETDAVLHYIRSLHHVDET